MDNNGLAVIETDGEVIECIDYESMNLKQLSTLINQQNASAEAATAAVLEYAIAAGLALLRARELVMGAGESWTRWLDENLSFHRRTAHRYIAIARGRDQLPGEPVTLTEALEILSSNPTCRDEGEWTSHPEALKSSALEMHADGVSLTEIGRTLGVVRETVRRWVDPQTHDRMVQANKRRRRRNAAARRALAEKERREERDRLAKVIGGITEKAYGDVRKLSATLNRAIGEVTPSARDSLREAERLALKAEDAIQQAMNEIRAAG
jgi:hypothetical protein